MIRLKEELRPDCREFEIYLISNGELLRVFVRRKVIG